MSPKETLRRLLRIQELALETRTSQKLLDAAPGRIEEIEERFRERNAEYVAVKDRHDALEADRKGRNDQLTELEEAKKKYTDSLMAVKNQREYAAVLKELDGVKTAIAGHEEAVLNDMEELEKLGAELKTHEEHIQEERVRVEAERAVVEREAREAEERIARHRSEREKIEAELAADLVASVHRIEETRQGLFLAEAKDGVCQACFVRIRPQVFQEIRRGLALHVCSSCKRYLYYAPLVQEAPAGAPSPANEGPELGAVDGGTV